MRLFSHRKAAFFSMSLHEFADLTACVVFALGDRHTCNPFPVGLLTNQANHGTQAIGNFFGMVRKPFRLASVNWVEISVLESQAALIRSASKNASKCFDISGGNYYISARVTENCRSRKAIIRLRDDAKFSFAVLVFADTLPHSKPRV